MVLTFIKGEIEDSTPLYDDIQNSYDKLIQKLSNYI